MLRTFTLAAALAALAACTVGDLGEVGDPELGPDAGAAVDDPAPAIDPAAVDVADADTIEPDAGPVDPLAGSADALGRWHPRAWRATRFAVFYQFGRNVLDLYADPATGAPHAPGHAYIMSHSHASVGADRATADRVHAARDDFFYAPAFDLNDHPGWATATPTALRRMAHAFRDEALAAHADLWSFNEAPSNTPTSPALRAQMTRLVRYLAEPDANGIRLRGVFYLTHPGAMPGNWTSAATDFWAALDETSVAVVAEHYHSQSWVCGTSESAIAEHLFAMRRWLANSGDAHKRSIATRKFTILHSSRYGDGASGWAGADATQTSLAQFQHALARLAKVSRDTPGGYNRISFAPAATSITDLRVHPRIALLLRWHYGAARETSRELGCVGGAAANCTCR